MKYLALFVLSGLLWSGCFEIKEEVTLHADGSGTLVLTLDFRESKDQLREYWAAGQINGYRLPSEQDIHNLFRIVRNSMQLTKGMGQVSYSLDFDNFVGKVQAEFPDVATLNRALTAITKNLDWLYVPTIEAPQYDWTGREFKRYYPFPEPPDDFDYAQLPLMGRYVLETARVVGVYRFDLPVQEASHPAATVSPSRHAVRVELTLAELARRQATLENTVRLAPRP